jgi:hypothetical protein
MTTDEITSWAGLAVGVLGALSVTAIAQGDMELAKYLAYASGVAMVIKGHFTNKPNGPDGLNGPNGRVSGWVLPFVLAGGLLTGCAWYEGLTPGAQKAIQEAAKIALSFGVSELGQSVKEVRPFEGQLKGIINTTFAQVQSPEAIAGELVQQVKATVPEELQPAVLAKFKAVLMDPSAPAGPTVGRDFNKRLARKL